MTEKPVVHLALKGGGAKGAFYVGGLRAIEEKGWQIDKIVATSAGALTAAAIDMGYDSFEIEKLLKRRITIKKDRWFRSAIEVEANEIMSFFKVPERKEFSEAHYKKSFSGWVLENIDIPGVPKWLQSWGHRQIFDLLNMSKSFRKAFGAIEIGGVYSHSEALKWIERLIEGKYPGKSNMTLKEASELTGRLVTFIATKNETGNFPEKALNAKTAPSMPYKLAVLASMLIPGIFFPLIGKAEWGMVDGEILEGCEIVDGGVCNNFPLDHLVYRNPSVMDTKTGEDNVIGFFLDSTNGHPEIIPMPVKEFFLSKSRIVKRISKAFNSMLESANSEIKNFPDHVVFFPAKDVDTLEFDMESSKMDKVIEIGYKITKAFLTGNTDKLTK